MAPHSSTFAWKIPWMEEPGRLQSIGSLRVRHDWATSLSLFTFHFHALEKEMATHSGVLAWRIPGTGKPGGLPSMGSHRVGHDWSDLAIAIIVRLHLCGELHSLLSTSTPTITGSQISLFYENRVFHISGQIHDPKEYIHPSVHCSTVYNSEDTEAT